MPCRFSGHRNSEPAEQKELNQDPGARPGRASHGQHQPRSSFGKWLSLLELRHGASGKGSGKLTWGISPWLSKLWAIPSNVAMERRQQAVTFVVATGLMQTHVHERRPDRYVPMLARETYMCNWYRSRTFCVLLLILAASPKSTKGHLAVDGLLPTPG